MGLSASPEIGCTGRHSSRSDIQAVERCVGALTEMGRRYYGGDRGRRHGRLRELGGKGQDWWTAVLHPEFHVRTCGPRAAAELNSPMAGLLSFLSQGKGLKKKMAAGDECARV